jgi:hypothetical protein
VAQEEFPRPQEAISTVPDLLGSFGIYLLFLALVQLLWVEHEAMLSSTRGWILTGLTLLGFTLSGRLLLSGKDGAPKGPSTARSLGIFTWITLLLGLMEFGRAYHLPSSSLTGLAIGLTALWAGQALGSSLLGLAGAYLLHSQANQILGLRLGKVGSLLSDHIFLGVALALGMVLLGIWKVRRGFRIEGLCLVGYGFLYSLTGLYFLSLYGELYHGFLESPWIHHLYLLILVGLAGVFLGVARNLRSGALVALPTLALYMRALRAYFEWQGEVPEIGLYFSLGLLLVFLAWRSESKTPGLEAPEPQSQERRQRLLRQARRIAMMLLMAAAMRGVHNQGSSHSQVRFPVEASHLTPLVYWQLDPFQIEAPPGVLPGEALDVYLQVWKLDEDGATLRFGRCIATRRGAGIPSSLNPDRCFKVPGRLVRCRLFDGNPLEVVIPRVRSLFELPRKLWNEPVEGRDMVFQVGRLGIPYPGGLVASGGHE